MSRVRANYFITKLEKTRLLSEITISDKCRSLVTSDQRKNRVDILSIQKKLLCSIELVRHPALHQF